ncbi:hypothetical protein MLD38_036669 [Melastoma candidum]|uniref:Uncharacterized protein n=1 Tax=Melastoma candidum TaxID=119954 RepID=A0ACB9LKN1_9MYRT|nr:hypothetical protein MLD38_036669 [Melastoma candidum]
MKLEMGSSWILLIRPVSYAQLARSIHELAATSDQKNSQKQLINHVFPKLAVYNSVDPSLAPSLLMQCEDHTVLRYVYYYLARILSDTGPQGLNPGGGIPTPNWDALADIYALGGVTRADVVPRVVHQLTTEATNTDTEYPSFGYRRCLFSMTQERAVGWYRLTREILKLPEAPSVSSKDSNSDGKDALPPKPGKDKSSKAKRPQPLIKLVMRRLESSFRSFSRPVLHAAARVVQEMGKSRAAAFAFGLQDIDEGVDVNAFAENTDSMDSDLSENPFSAGARKTSSVSKGAGTKDTVASLLASLMEVVRTTVACECVYVRAMVIKAPIWMQSPHESFEELGSIIASELSDPSCPGTLLNDVLLTLHARFKATLDMAVTLLEIARIFATKVPGKIDADVLQLLWKTCLVGAGPDGKHTALEAVTVVLDLPPPQPGSMTGLTSVNAVSASDPKSALALQRLVQAAVWFLGENANYAASEHAWESATPPGTAVMMLDADKMVAAASSRNPTPAICPKEY